MSVDLMEAVFQSTTLGATERLIMLALADHAGDDGRCYPSIQRLMQRTGLGERSIQGNIKRLAEAGEITIVRGGGRGCSNIYVINMAPKPRAKNPVSDDINPAYGAENPAAETPFLITNPASDAENPAYGAENPAANAPEPSRTIKNRNSNISSRDQNRAVRSVLLDVAGPDAVDSFMAYRARSKGKALTETAAKRLAKNLDQIFQNGGDADDALGMAEERSWLTVNPEWYFNAKGRNNDRFTHQRQQNARADAADREISIAAGFARTPSDDCF